MGRPIRPFRFGVVAAPRTAVGWATTARRAADLGFTTLLAPDGMHLLAPLPALALAAGATGLRVGTFVLAAPLRPPRTAAWEAHTLSVLTDGRFELGIGTGLPGSAQEAERIGLPSGSAAQRLARVEQTIGALRELDGERHTPVLVAASGPRAVSLAARLADVVALALPPTATPADVDDRVATLRRAAGDRMAGIELSTNLLGIGDDLPDWLARAAGTDLATLRASGSFALLRGTPVEIADELLRRRERWGASYVTIGEQFAEALGPVVERLAGR